MTLILGGTASVAMAGDGLSVSLNPQRVCTGGRSGTYPNVDLIVRNDSDAEVQVDEIHALLHDRSGRLVERRTLWQQAVNVIGSDRVLGPRSTRTIFNPFTFSNDVAGKKLTFEVLAVGGKSPAIATTTPQRCANHYALSMPVRGRVLVYDGFDALSHHRRGTYDDEWSRAMGIRDNFQRFGLDLVVIDAAGRYFRGDGTRTDQWFGWGQPVIAAASGMSRQCMMVSPTMS